MELKIYSKRELAMAYAPDITAGAAVNRLMQWISLNRSLHRALTETGYHKSQKLFSIRQVSLIFEHLGEP